MKEMKLDRQEFNLLVNNILLDVKPVKLRIIIANRLVEFFDKKQEQIAELEEQLKKMTPKFKVGQKIYMADCKKMSVFSATITKTIFTLHKKNEHFHMYDIIKDIEPDWICGTSEEWLFASKEEALKKLEELKGENK